MPHANLMGKPGAAYLPRSGRRNRKLIFPRLFYFDTHHEPTQRDRTQGLSGYTSESFVELRASEIEDSDTEWQSARETVTHLAPAPRMMRMPPTSTSAMAQAQALLLLLAKTRASYCAHCQPHIQIHSLNIILSEMILDPAP